MGSRKHANKAAAAAVEAADAAVKAAKAAEGADEDDDDAVDVGPLFDFQGADAEHHEGTRVFRLEPVDEGHLDDLAPDADRKDIKRRWGGGLFKVQAFSAKKKIMATDSGVKISGDPIFENEVGRKRYEKWLAQQFPTDRTVAGASAGPDAEDVRETRHNRELAKLRAEAELREQSEERRRMREREERRAEAVEREEREEARRQREERARAEERKQELAARAEEREAQRQHEVRLEAARAAERAADRENRTDPMQQLAVFAQIMGGMGGPDPVSAVIQNAPAILEQVRETGVAIASAGSSRRKEERQIKAAGDKVQLEGRTAKLAIAAIQRLQKLGKDPEQVMGQFFAAAAQAKAPEGRRLPPKRPTSRPASRPAPRGNANGHRANAAHGTVKPRSKAAGGPVPPKAEA